MGKVMEMPTKECTLGCITCQPDCEGQTGEKSSQLEKTLFAIADIDGEELLKALMEL